MLPKCFQNGPKWGPDGLWSPVWAWEAVDLRSIDRPFGDHLGTSGTCVILSPTGTCDFRFHWLACKHEDRCKVCLENLIKIYSKIHQKLFQIASKKLPKQSRAGPRRPLESTWEWGTLPKRVSLAKLRPFGSQNWCQNPRGSLQKSI